MKYNCALIVVDDIKASREFYETLFEQKILNDFGANVAYESGISLQAKDVWVKFINKPENEIIYKHNSAELYFEEDNYDSFIEKLKKRTDIELVHDTLEFSWGQRAIRFYDPDKHIIEVGETMDYVIKRFLNNGMTIKETAKKTQHSVEHVLKCYNNLKVNT